MNALDLVRTLRRAGYDPHVCEGALRVAVQTPPEPLLRAAVREQLSAVKTILRAGEIAYGISLAQYPRHRRRARKARNYAERLAANVESDPLVIAVLAERAAHDSFRY